MENRPRRRFRPPAVWVRHRCRPVALAANLADQGFLCVEPSVKVKGMEALPRAGSRADCADHTGPTRQTRNEMTPRVGEVYARRRNGKAEVARVTAADGE